MNFPGIALGNGSRNNNFNSWQTTNLNDKPQASEPVAIILAEGDQGSLKTAQGLQKTSGLGIPIIEVSHKTISSNGRRKIINAVNKYAKKMAPGFLTDSVSFAEDHSVSFTTLGHHNGLYYEKHPAGAVFNRFFGRDLMFADTSNTVPELDDTMTHEGMPLTAEQKAVETCHADKVYFYTNRTTSANSICASTLLTKDNLALFDRNNHKLPYNSALAMSGAKPVYILTDRNTLGLIGETDPDFLSEERIRVEVIKVDPKKVKVKRPFRLTIIQLETCDGLFYDAKWVIDKIGKLCDHILFDCAWSGSEQPVPIMNHLPPLNLGSGLEDPGILVTQSLYK